MFALDFEEMVTAADAQRAAALSASRIVDQNGPLLASRLVSMQREAPHLPASVAYGLASAGYDSSSPQFATVAGGYSAPTASAQSYRDSSGRITLDPNVKAQVIADQHAAEAAAQQQPTKDDRWSGGLLGDAWAGIRSGVEGVTRDVLHPATQVVEGAVSAPMELAMGTLRSGVGWMPGMPTWMKGSWVNPFTQTRLYQKFRHWGDSGQGWFIAGKDAQRSADEQARALRIYDKETNQWHAMTFGRFISAELQQRAGVDPAFHIGDHRVSMASAMMDAYMTLTKDPGAAIGRSVREARAANRLFTTAEDARSAIGYVNAVRPFVHRQTAATFLASEHGDMLVKDLRGRTAGDIWIRSNGRMDPAVARELEIAGKESDAAVRAVLGKHLGLDMPEIPKINAYAGYGGYEYTVRAATNRLRFTQAVPVRKLNIDDAGQAVQGLYLTARNAKLDPKITEQLVTKMIKHSDSRAGMYDVIANDLMRVIEKKMVLQYHVKPEEARTLTRLWKDTNVEQQLRAIDELGHPVGYFVLNNDAVPIEGIAEYQDLLTNGISMPDYRRIRSHISAYQRILTKPERWTNARRSAENAGMTGTAVEQRVARKILAGDALTPAERLIPAEAWGETFSPNLLRSTFHPKADKIRAGIDAATAAADFAQKYFKAWTILRLGYIPRVVGEEQLRMAAAGWDSMFLHPISYFSWVLGQNNKNLDTALLGEFAGKRGAAALGKAGFDPRGSLDALGSAWMRQMAESDSAIARAMSHGTGRYSDPAKIMSTQYRTVHRSEGRDAFVEAWAHDISRRSRSAPTQMMVKYMRDTGTDAYTHLRGAASRFSAKLGNDEAAIDAIGTADLTRRFGAGRDAVAEVAGKDPMTRWVDWMMSEDGSHYRQELITAGHAKSVSQRAAAAGKEGYADMLQALDTRSGVEAYGEFLANQIWRTTGGDAVLTDALGDGWTKFGKHLHPTELAALVPGAAPRVDKAFRKYLENLYDEGLGPVATRGPITVAFDETSHAATLARYDKGLNYLFDIIASRPTNLLSRSPVFRQSYWREVERLGGALEVGDMNKLIANARDAGLEDVAKRLQRVKFGDGPRIKLEQVDKLAKGRAMHEVQSLLFDLHDRNQAFDALRLVFPFGDAFKEVAQRWPKLLAQNPNALYRTQQVTRNARDSGFFARDDQGNETFVIPFSQQLLKMTTGVPMPLTARVDGLNMIGSGLPGVGWAVQLPAGALLPDTPNWNWARDIIMPYGQQDTSHGLLESFFPGWLQKIRTSGMFGHFGEASPDEQRLFANSVGDMMIYKASTGAYNLSRPEEVQRLVDDSKAAAKKLWLVRGLAQLASPVAPSPQSVIKDKTGKINMLRTIVDDYRAMVDKNPETAVGEFLNKYGDNAFLAMQPKTWPRTYGLQATTDMANFASTNKSFVRQFPTTWALFAPRSERQDYTEYLRELQTGERGQNIEGGARLNETAQNFVYLAQHRVASYVYDRVRASLPDTISSAQRQGLSNIKQQLTELFPGYRDAVFPARPQFETGLAELTRAVNSREMANNPTARAVRNYLALRDAANALAISRGYASFADATATEPIRDSLRQAASMLISQYPTFFPVWDEFLSREGRLSDPLTGSA